MPKIHPIQNDFTAGIITPRFFARSDIEGYERGLAECINFIPLKHGPLERRHGTIYDETIEGTLARVFGFQLSADISIGEAFAVVVTDTILKVIGATGFKSGTELLTNSIFSGGISPWAINETGTATVDWTSGGVILNAGTVGVDVQYCEVSQEVTIGAGKENDTHVVSFNTDSAPGFGRPRVELRVGTTEGAGDIFVGPSGSEITPAGNSTIWVTVRAYSTFQSTGSIAGEPGITSKPSVTLKSVSLVDTDSVGIEFSHTWTLDEIRKLKAQMNPESDVMYFYTGDSVPKQLVYDRTTNAWAFNDISFVATPTEWTGDTWPSVMSFFASRSYWSGVKGYPNRIWGSKVKSSTTNTYFNMTTGVDADDALDFTITKRGQIRWMQSMNKLVAGTDNSEFLIDSQDGVITPSDLQTVQQSSNGGSFTQPIEAGSFITYISSDGRKIYNTIYRWTENTWRSRDLTFSAEDITQNVDISEMTYTKNPENIIWFCTRTSNLIACTFDPVTENIGWHRHDIGGDILSIASADLKGVSFLFMIVRRAVDGVNKLFLEHIDFSSSTLLDSSVEIEDQSQDITSVSVPHLANELVSVTVDGAVHPDIQLDGSGNADLVTYGNKVIVGYKYSSKMKTLPADYGYVSGSGMGLQKRWNKIQTRIITSLPPLINGSRPADRSPATPMDEREPYGNMDVKVINLGFDTFGQIEIEQDLPVRCTITGIFGELSESSL